MVTLSCTHTYGSDCSCAVHTHEPTTAQVRQQAKQPAKVSRGLPWRGRRWQPSGPPSWRDRWAAGRARPAPQRTARCGTRKQRSPAISRRCRREATKRTCARAGARSRACGRSRQPSGSPSGRFLQTVPQSNVCVHRQRGSQEEKQGSHLCQRRWRPRSMKTRRDQRLPAHSNELKQ